MIILAIISAAAWWKKRKPPVLTSPAIKELRAKGYRVSTRVMPDGSLVVLRSRKRVR